ncbi:hypothetical protein BD779DRAFT_1608361 [Infundibulicybe gibba]|nr:hypothetical protein BD779DRAFT_1608361 [Infundibulicybe gibba]
MSSSSSSSSSDEGPKRCSTSGDSDAEASDVPVLSHAERRRQKKKEKSKAEGGGESALKKQKLQDGTASTTTPTPKRQNSVWVGNMSYKTTPEALRTFFEGVGEITRIHMPTKAPAGPGMKGESRGFAYVDFETPEAKTAAIARSERPLIGRKLLIKDGDDFTGRPALPAADGTAGTSSKTIETHSKSAQKILRAQKQPSAPTLFLGNLGFETTEEAIRELFEAHRISKKKSKDSKVESEDKKADTKDVWIRKIRMGTFEDSGLCKGFAFIDFLTTEYATEALINPKNHSLNGRKLVVEYAGADAVRRGAPKPKRDQDAPSKPRRDTKSYDRELHAPNANDQEYQPSSSLQYPLGNHSCGSNKREKGPRVRPKPGAALALAKRESAAIVPSKGQKITF